MQEPPKGPRQLKALAPPKPDQPVPANYAVALAMRAFRDGQADPAQQQLLFDWIFYDAAGCRFPSFHPTERDTCFALGRRFVGEQMHGLLQADLAYLRGDSNEVP